MSSPRVITAEEIEQLDAVLFVAGFPPPQILGNPHTKRHDLKDSPVGPTLADLNDVIAFLREQHAANGKPLKIGAYGGARLLAAAALSVGLAERRLAEGEDVATLCTDHNNWIDKRPRNVQLVAEIVMLPATILAAQAAPAKTWICNDPREESTFWASNDSLVAGTVCLDFVKVRHGIAIVAGVLLECVCGTPVKPRDAENLAQTRAEQLLAQTRAEQLLAQTRAEELLVDLGRDLTNNANLQTLTKFAYESRDCENVIGPDMPGLALKQAVERVLFKYGKDGVPIDADCVAAWLIPDVSDALGRDRSRFDECFDHLRALCPRPEIPQQYFARIADAAALTKLAQRCEGASAEFYKTILENNLKLQLS